MVQAQIEAVVQSVDQVPVPSEREVVGGLVGIAEATRVVMDTEYREVAPPTARPLLVGHLSAVGEVLDGLHLNITHSIDVEALALVVASLVVNHCGNGVAGEVVVGEPAIGTRGVDIVPHEIVAIGIIHGNARIGAQHVGEVVGILVANLDTLALTMLEVQVLTNLDNIPVADSVDDML